MSNLDPTPVLDYYDVVTLYVPPNTARIFRRNKRLMWIIFSSIAVLIILAIIIPITVIFTKESGTNITTISTTITTKSTIITTTTIKKTSLHFININANAKWAENGIMVAGDNEYGHELNQFLHPEAIYVDDDQTIYITDCDNHRIVEWKNGAKNGQIIAGGNGKGNLSDQLNAPTHMILDKVTNSIIVCDSGNKRVVQWPRQNGIDGQTIISDVLCYGLAIDDEGYIYISDHERHEVRRWQVGNTSGIVVAGGNGKGNRSDQLFFPTNIFVDQNHSVYISEQNNSRVTKWLKDAKVGIVVAGGQNEGNGLTQLSSPRGIVVDQLNVVYVADSLNNRIMCWFEDATQGSIVVRSGNGTREESNQLYAPVGLSFDQQGNLYVSEREKHRVLRFDIN